jgi:hypothetical protein
MEASGVITNTATAAHNYMVTVYFTNAHATVIGSGEISKSITGKGTGTWMVTANFVAPRGVKCLLVSVK